MNHRTRRCIPPRSSTHSTGHNDGSNAILIAAVTATLALVAALMIVYVCYTSKRISEVDDDDAVENENEKEEIHCQQIVVTKAGSDDSQQKSVTGLSDIQLDSSNQDTVV